MNVMSKCDLSVRKPLFRPGPASRRTDPGAVVHGSYPWWLEEADAAGLAPAARPPLIGAGTVDVAIVGGGYTGLWTALALRERHPDLRIAVLEAGICGAGASGRNGGFVHGYWEMFAKLVDLLGHDRALTIAQAGSEAQRAITRFCASRPEDVWLHSAGLALGSTSAAQDAAVDKALRSGADLSPEFGPRELTADELATMCNTSSFRRGALFPEAATVQPARLVQAMRTAAEEAGIRIFEGTPVLGVDTGRTTVVRSPMGRLACADVVLAANAWMSASAPYSRHVTNLGSYAIVTEPAPDLIADMGWQRGFAIKDARMFLHWARTTHDDRIIVGTGAGPMSFGGRVSRVHTAHQATAARCVAALHRFFPQSRDLRVTHAWGGPIDMSADRIPFFGTLPGTRVHYGTGYSGHGVNAAWIGGQVLASLVLGAEDRWTASPFCGRQVPRLPPEPVRYLGGKVIHRASLSVEDAHDRGEAPPVAARGIAALPRVFGLRIGLR